MKYSDLVCKWLADEGYTHCFFVAGGNIMHLLESASHRFTCVPFVNEVGAGIAAEYFNATAGNPDNRAFCLVTAGPGLTNVVTALSGAYLESRELLVLGGQVKSSDLTSPRLRQRGIQEVDGVALATSTTKVSLRIEAPVSRSVLLEAVHVGQSDRKGPVFLEFCLDAQGATVDPAQLETPAAPGTDSSDTRATVEPSTARLLRQYLHASQRPIILVGGGVSRASFAHAKEGLARAGIPVATTWNATDRLAYEDPLYFGRPDTWGMRWANVLLQQADLIIAVGARLSLQQTGFNWQQFAPLAKVVHVDIDPAELEKGHPRKDLCVLMGADAFLEEFLGIALAVGDRYSTWRAFASRVREALPLDDPANLTRSGFISPYRFVQELSNILTPEDVVVPCSSGGASTVMMQAFKQKEGQVVINNKALASMGYGLSGAIGSALANPGRRVILTEGDGGFAQNLQELGTVSAQMLPIKIFLFCNDGYASIRMTQRNYFHGNYLGCDERTGLGLPDWELLFKAYGIPCFDVPVDPDKWEALEPALSDASPVAFLVPIDPEQTYYPKITSAVDARGFMASRPLHEMDPPLSESQRQIALPYLEATYE